MRSKLIGLLVILYAAFMIFCVVAQFDFIKGINPKLSAWMALLGVVGFIFIFVLAGISIKRSGVKSTAITIIVFFAIVAAVMLTFYLVSEYVPGGARFLNLLFGD